MSKFHTAPMKDGIRYDSRGEPMTTRTITVEALAAALHRVPMMDWTDVDAVPDYAAAIFAALPAAEPAGAAWNATRELRIESGPVVISQVRTDPGDMGEPRVLTSDGVTYVAVPDFDGEWSVAEPAGAGHEPGEHHRYRIECEVCGQRGTVVLSLEPQRAALAATPVGEGAG